MLIDNVLVYYCEVMTSVRKNRNVCVLNYLSNYNHKNYSEKSIEAQNMLINHLILENSPLASYCFLFPG